MAGYPPKSEPHKIFGQTLTAMRERIGATQWYVAHFSGIAKKSYTEYELGQKAPKDLIRLHRICDVLRMTADEREALVECWGSIGSNNRIVHTAAILAKQAQMKEEDTAIMPVDPELRRVQNIIDQIKASSHPDAPHMWAGMLDCIARIGEQGTEYLRRTRQKAA